MDTSFQDRPRLEIDDRSAHGLRITHTRSTFGGRSKHRVKSDDDVVRLHFGLRGSYEVRYPEVDRSFEIVGGQLNLLYAAPFEMEFENHSETLETFGVQFPVSRFVEYAEGLSAPIARFREAVGEGRKGVLTEDWPALTPAMERVIQEMRDSPFCGPLGDLFLLSKSIELLARSFAAIEASTGRGGVTIPSTTKEKLIAARDLVCQRMTDPPALAEVARAVGLNEFKLKRGFKAMFGTTLFGYLTDLRLDRALRDLVESERTAAEIAFSLGYATPQHFGAAFKKRFGVTPKTARKNPSRVTLRGRVSAAAS